jgi:hypothetical protein
MDSTKLRAEMLRKFICGMPICEPAGEEGRSLGCEADGGENEGLPLAQAPACRLYRVCGVDRGWAPAALPVYGVARLEKAQGCKGGMNLVARGMDPCQVEGASNTSRAPAVW